MIKKTCIAFLAALMLIAPASRVVFAGETEQGRGRRGRFVYGEVISVQGDGFSVASVSGEEFSFGVDETTLFRGGEFKDLMVGGKVAVAAPGGEGSLARVVIILPDDFEPGGRFAIRVRGEVTAVDSQAGKFRVETPGGEIITFFVDGHTRYGGQLEDLSDMQVGWKAAVAAREDDDGGKRVATLVIAGERPGRIKLRGEVVAVDSQAGKFRVETPGGEVVTFFVDENTRYGGQLDDLTDLKVGWMAGVAAKEGEDGKLIAVVVIAGERRGLIRARGEITALASSGKFRLRKPNGDVLTFFVDENTHYRGQAGSFRDLELGWKARVAAVEREDGTLVARWIIAGPPRRRPHPERERPFRDGEGKREMRGGPALPEG